MMIYENIKKQLSLKVGRKISLLVLVATAIMTCSLHLLAKPDDAIPYPTGYRDWTHIKSTVIGPKNPSFDTIGGIQHIYANEKAMEGYRSGQFPEGSVLVYDFFEPKSDEKKVDVTYEGPRRFTAVMVKQTKRFAKTGGWGYEEFRGDSQTDRIVGTEAASVTMCYACHTKQKDSDFVFSKYRK